jgi:hypothetical protein
MAMRKGSTRRSGASASALPSWTAGPSIFPVSVLFHHPPYQGFPRRMNKAARITVGVRAARKSPRGEIPSGK